MERSEAEELMKPPTQLEVAELLNAAKSPDKSLSAAGVMVLRRLIFDRDKLRFAATSNQELLSACKMFENYYDFGKLSQFPELKKRIRSAIENAEKAST